MKFNIFSKKKKKDKGASIQATDFLNPRDGNLDDLKGDDKKSKNKKESSKEENKVSKKEQKKVQKKKKAEAKKAKKEAKEKVKEKKKKKREEEKKKKEDKQKKNRKKKTEKEDKKEGIETKKQSAKKEKKEKAQVAKDIKKTDKEDLQAKKEAQDTKTLEEKKGIREEKEISKEEKDVVKESSNHEFEKSSILEINLVKDEINVYFDWYKNIAFLVVFVFLSFVLVGEVYLALIWWQEENNSTVSQEAGRFIELSEETKKIRGEAEEALTFQTKLNRANYILDKHIYWSNFFDYLERNTLENIQYISFEGDILGDFSIPAISDSFPSLGQQVYQLQSDPNTIKVSIDSGEKLESEEENLEQVEFNINLKVDPVLFKK